MTKRDRYLRAGVELEDSFALQPEDAQILSWFMDLNGSRQCWNSGPQPISYLEIQAWLAVSREPASTDQILRIKAMDEAYITAHHKIMDEQQKERDVLQKAVETAKKMGKG